MGGEIVAERFEAMKKGQAERLFPMLEEVLGEAGARWEELAAIGVGVGPGNFTGIRIAVSAARGLSLSLGIPAIGVTSFEIVRGALEGQGPDEIVSLPAPRDHAYLQTFKDGTAGPPERVELSMEALQALPRKPAHMRVVGHAAARIAGELTAPDAGRPDGPHHGGNGEGRSIGTWASTLAFLSAARYAEARHHAAPAPLYVRPPDAAPASDPPPVILP